VNALIRHAASLGKKPARCLVRLGRQGAVAVEYAFCIALAAVLMTGVSALFFEAIVKVVRRAVSIAASFPSI
jgi:Flp pilus assembly pilin Flp